MTDKGIVWIVVGALVFWLAILFPQTTGAVLMGLALTAIY
jgi:hypothetical protein